MPERVCPYIDISKDKLTNTNMLSTNMHQKCTKMHQNEKMTWTKMRLVAFGRSLSRCFLVIALSQI